jgi:APA family basic amino acid/polyamine antiporter
MTTRAEKPALRLFDVVSLGVGIIIGAGIFRLPKDVFGSVPDAATGMGLWVLGGFLAAAGALCYAELAGAYPHSSGEYVYLRKAYGPFVGFGFAWAMLTVIRTGASIAPIAYVFAEYAQRLHDFGPNSKLIYVTAAIGGLTLVNAFGIHPGRRTQNALTLAKVLGLAGIVIAGLYLYLPSSELIVPAPMAAKSDSSLVLALVLVLWAYSGWHEVAYVVADLRNHHRNFAWAILLGVGAVAVVYVAVNAALLAGLGWNDVRRSDAVGAELLRRALGAPGEKTLAALVIISTLGAVNGTILTGGRFFSGFGELHPGFGWLCGGRTRRGAPLVALVAQATISLGMVVLVETGDVWKAWLAERLQGFGVTLPLDFAKPTDGFETLVACTAPVFWFFFLLTSGALFILRAKEPDRPRPFRVPALPIVGVVFTACCLFMLYQSTQYAAQQRPAEAVVVGALLLLGLPVYVAGRRGHFERGTTDENQNR